MHQRAQEQKVATGLKQRTQHHTLHAEPLREKAFENSMRPSSLHIGCARSAQRTCAKRACANMQAPFIFKSLHPGNDTTSLRSDWQSWLLPRDFHAHTGLPIGSPTPAQDSATDSSGAKTHRPLCSLGIA